jgi:hypothetical protein
MNQQIVPTQFSLLRQSSGEWKPWCSVCRKSVARVNIEFGHVIQHYASWNSEFFYTGFNEWSFECHGERVTFRLDQRDPDNPKIVGVF